MVSDECSVWMSVVCDACKRNTKTLTELAGGGLGGREMSEMKSLK